MGEISPDREEGELQKEKRIPLDERLRSIRENLAHVLVFDNLPKGSKECLSLYDEYLKSIQRTKSLRTLQKLFIFSNINESWVEKEPNHASFHQLLTVWFTVNDEAVKRRPFKERDRQEVASALDLVYMAAKQKFEELWDQRNVKKTGPLDP